MIVFDCTSPTTIRALSLTNWVVNLCMRSWRVCLILAWIALTRCLFLARWAVANALAYLSVCLICNLLPFEFEAMYYDKINPLGQVA